VLELARADLPDIMGVVSIHGNFGTAAPASNTTAYKVKVLVLHGANDTNIMNTPQRGDNSGAMPALESELNSAKIPWEITKFAGAQHGFAALGNAYDPVLVTILLCKYLLSYDH
jgi:dienelactone hydrolase